MAISFTGEEKIDLLLKKVAYGVSKTGTSNSTTPAGEGITSFKAVAPTHVWKEATDTNIPSSPGASSTAYVGTYLVDGTADDVDTVGNVAPPVECTMVASAELMPGYSTFKRAWTTGKTNWIGPAFGSDYAVKVYLGATGWNGLNSTKAANGVHEVIFGDNPNADWFFDYEAGVLYWTNEEGSDSGSNGNYDDSVNFVNNGSVVADDDVVYIEGRQYIGATGVGTTPDTATQAAEGVLRLISDDTQTETAQSVTTTSNRSYGLQLNASNQGVVNVPWVNTEYTTATDSVLGLVKTGYNENGKNYPVELSSGQMYVNVPWTDTSGIDNIGVTEGTDNTTHRIVLTTAAANGSYTGTMVDTNDLTYVPAAGSNAGTLKVGKLEVAGDFTVSGAFTSTTSTTVTYEDAVLDLNVPNTATTDVSTDSGFRFGRSSAAANVLDAAASFLYDPGTDTGDPLTQDYSGCFRFTRNTDDTLGAIASADNVAALKFTKTDTHTATDADDADTDLPDDHITNGTTARSLGAVSKARITITNATTDGDSGTGTVNTNYAPDIAWEDGYPIKHNLSTTGVYVVAVKDPAGTPIPITVRYEPINNRFVRVWLGKTAEDEVYDIIVIG